MRCLYDNNLYLICHRKQILKCNLDLNNTLLYLIKISSLLPNLWHSMSVTCSSNCLLALVKNYNMFLLPQTMRKPVGYKFRFKSEWPPSKQRDRNYSSFFTTVRIPLCSSSSHQKDKPSPDNPASQLQIIGYGRNPTYSTAPSPILALWMN